MSIAKFVDHLKSFVGNWGTTVVLEFEGQELEIQDSKLTHTGAFTSPILILTLTEKEA